MSKKKSTAEGKIEPKTNQPITAILAQSLGKQPGI